VKLRGTKLTERLEEKKSGNKFYNLLVDVRACMDYKTPNDDKLTLYSNELIKRFTLTQFEIATQSMKLNLNRLPSTIIEMIAVTAKFSPCKIVKAEDEKERKKREEESRCKNPLCMDGFIEMIDEKGYIFLQNCDCNDFGSVAKYKSEEVSKRGLDLLGRGQVEQLPKKKSEIIF